MSVSSADLIDEQKASYQKACYRRNKPSARSSRPAPLKKDNQITKKRNQTTQTTTQTTQITRSTRSTRSTKSNTTYQAFAGHVFCSIASRTTCDGGTSGAAPSLCCVQLWSQTEMSAGGGWGELRRRRRRPNHLPGDTGSGAQIRGDRFFRG